MTSSTERITAAYARVIGGSIAAIVIGFAILLLGTALDWDGFWGGFATGGGLALVGVGMYLWGYANGLRKTRTRAAWLPSADARG